MIGVLARRTQLRTYARFCTWATAGDLQHAERSRAGRAFGLQLQALTAMSDAGLRLKHMCAPRGLGRQRNLCGKDALRYAGCLYSRLTSRPSHSCSQKPLWRRRASSLIILLPAAGHEPEHEQEPLLALEQMSSRGIECAGASVD